MHCLRSAEILSVCVSGNVAISEFVMCVSVLLVHVQYKICHACQLLPLFNACSCHRSN